MTASIYHRAAALLVVLAATPSIVEAAGNSDDSGGDIVIDSGYDNFRPYDEIDNPTGISKIEYFDLLNFQREVVEFWTPDRLANAQPLHMKVGFDGLNKFYEENKESNLGEAAAAGADALADADASAAANAGADGGVLDALAAAAAKADAAYAANAAAANADGDGDGGVIDALAGAGAAAAIAAADAAADAGVFDAVSAAGAAAADAEEDGEEDVRHKRRNLRSLQQVGSAAWSSDGDVLHAAGRLMFQKGGNNYRCSATVIQDGDLRDGQSLIITAAHCVYDADNKRFAKNFMFIPHQDDRGRDVSDRNCNNDKYGCWTPSHAVVDRLWSSKTWQDNIPQDYAILVVPNVGSHRGPSGVNDSLEVAVPALEVSWERPRIGQLSYALGYPGDMDVVTNPSDFRYCRQILTERKEKEWGGLMLEGCGLTAGASGGPWIQDISRQGRGKIIGVNSYGPGGFFAFLNPYMGAPRLYNNSAWCLFEKARRVSRVDADGGIIVTWTPGNCAGSVVKNQWGGVIAAPAPATPAPTPEPTEKPTPEPTPAPTPEPTPALTPEPTPGPTPSPTKEPSTEPTPNPTPSPTPAPTTTSPTTAPTPPPTLEPTPPPSPAPTPAPTDEPTPAPTPGPSAS
eukprot:CAMPEP_0181098726 /NCGR_PEP_ID=MMETSP1071-20121207/12282_1 /TAXON_ID=35127 /ORGANISM="Thalassiosira sp., Strain NH16" /LENGTH=627 /DNA_ID=CAMNT_0023181345 /DNA_START=72 /DNA_END=1952 /DNA_ORIENTATION=+